MGSCVSKTIDISSLDKVGITIINCSYNQIYNTLPLEIGNLTNLRILNCSYSEYTLPLEMENLRILWQVQIIIAICIYNIF